RPNATAAPTLSGNCLQRGRPIKTPSWYPADLPMPPGSYAIQEPKAERGLRRVVFASKGDLRAFVVHALKEWKARGWSLGKGESEPGEAEDNFLKDDRYGVFRARSVFCEQDWTWVLIVLTSRTAPTPSFNTQTSASPSPLSS
ncbi:MAG: hypothetical protein ACRDJM_05025, partial [Actinomycetota bacterium]